MCNLYDIGPDRRNIRAAFEAEALSALGLLPKLLGIRKTDQGLTVRLSESRYRAEIMRWGVVREYNNAINNTRDDKLRGGLWADAFTNRRCLIPMGAFYEWAGSHGNKQAHVIREPDPDNWLWCAGIWEVHPDHGPCYSMITTSAPPWMTHLHHRIPALFQSIDAARRYLADPAPEIEPPLNPLAISRCASPLKSPEDPATPDLPGFEEFF